MADVNWNLAVTPDPFKQIAEGADYSRRIFDQAALLQAGTQYAGGDLTGAANTVARRGDFATAGKLQDFATNREAGALYAGGDYSGAGKVLARGGDITGAETLADKQIQTVQRQQNAIGRSGQFFDAAIKDAAIKQDPRLADQAWNMAKQQLQAAQIPPERIAEFERLDPATRGAIMSHIGDQKIEFQKTDDGKLYQFMNGQLVNTYGGDSGPYRGTSPEATDRNTLLKGVKDPAFRNTPEYAVAWNSLNRPQTQIINGQLVSIAPNVSAWAPRPGSSQGGAADSVPSGTVPAPEQNGTQRTPGPIGGSASGAPGATQLPSGAAPPSGSFVDANGVTYVVDPNTHRATLPDGTPYTPVGESHLAPGGNAAANVPSAPPQAGPAPASPPAPAAATPVPRAPNVTVTPVPGLQPSGTVRDATQEELTARGYKPGTRGQFDTQTQKLTITDKPTPEDYKAAEYANRLTHAAETLDRLNQQGIVKPTAQVLVSDRNGVLRFVFSNQKDRQFVQAAKEWLAPVLRKDSGAAVNESEYGYYEDIYIPRPEDGPEVLAQKAAARANYEDTLYGQAGPLAVQMYGPRKPRAKPSTARGPYAPGRGQLFIPKPSIDALRQNPQRAAEFDKKYGAGAAKSVLGR